MTRLRPVRGISSCYRARDSNRAKTRDRAHHST
jgi:hypothetical protein